MKTRTVFITRTCVGRFSTKSYFSNFTHNVRIRYHNSQEQSYSVAQHGTGGDSCYDCEVAQKSTHFLSRVRLQALRGVDVDEIAGVAGADREGYHDRHEGRVGLD